MSILDEYYQEYEHCFTSLRLVKEIVAKDFIEATKPPKIVAELREKWLEFFSQAGLYNTCHACQGACCSKVYYTSLRIIDLFYFLWQDPEFEFPIPDWKFLKAESEKPTVNRWQNSYPCLFLYKNGCLLKEKKPNTCLFHFDCRTLQLKARILGLDASGVGKDWCLAEKELILWSQRILEHLGTKLVGDLTWHMAMMVNYIIFSESSEFLRDLLKNKEGGKAMPERGVSLCPRDTAELRKVQREYKGEFYLMAQCPVCFAVSPVFASSVSRWQGIPEAANVSDETMEFIASIKD